MSTIGDAEDPISNGPAEGNFLLACGLVLTLVYVAGMCVYAWFRWDAVWGMRPDAFATFLSGVFAPLAFLWLVLGFEQQGDELKNSARALRLQGEELRHSVEQQRQLVEVSREQLAAEYGQRLADEEAREHAAQPILLMSASGSYSGYVYSFMFQVTNAGPGCSDAKIVVDGRAVSEASLLPRDSRFAATLEYNSASTFEDLLLTVEYTDTRGNRRAQTFLSAVDPTGGPNERPAFGRPVRQANIDHLEQSASSRVLASS